MSRMGAEEEMFAICHAPKRGDCDKCGGSGFIPQRCCNGRECGCMGWPIDFTECGCQPFPSDEELRKWAADAKAAREQGSGG